MRKNFGKKTWFYPLPVLIIGSYDEDGRADAMNAAWGGIYDSDKVVGVVNRENFIFELKEPQFDYAGNSNHNQNIEK